MQRPIKYVEKGITKVASGMWRVFQSVNRKVEPNPAFKPKWSDKPVLKSWERTKPPLGWPRQTDSLCPECVKAARKAILDGEVDYTVLKDQKVGEIKATILERDGQIWMVKDCLNRLCFQILAMRPVEGVVHSIGIIAVQP